LTRRKIDHALFILDWYRSGTDNKMTLAAHWEAVVCLTPSVLGRLNEYRATRASGACNEVVLQKERAAISAFSHWERKIRAEARIPPYTVFDDSTPKLGTGR
jgi:hypothetical protein